MDELTLEELKLMQQCIQATIGYQVDKHEEEGYPTPWMDIAVKLYKMIQSKEKQQNG